MAGGIKITDDGIRTKLNGMLDRSNSLQAYFNKNVFIQYQKAQVARWQSENTSEGEKWDPLKPDYYKRKLKKYASYPGAGHALMIATSKLSESAMGRDTAGFFKIATNYGISVELNLGAIPYARRVSYQRPTMTFGKDTIWDMEQKLVDFISKAKVYE